MGPGNRPLDLEWLEDFLALAESGNFSRAAQARHIAQPAFSRHIKSLEEWTGVPLFDRSEHPAVLTPAGQRFKPMLEDLLGRLESARSLARAAHDEAAAGLRFAATHLLSLAFFPSWFSRVEQTLGPRTVQMHSNNLEACEDLMLQRHVQFLLCYGHPEVPGRLETSGHPMHPIGEETLLPVAAARPDGAPAFCLDDPTTSPVPLPVLAYHASSGLGRMLQACLRARLGGDAQHHTVFAAHHAVVLKAMALEGRGIAWLPRSLVAAELASGQLVAAGNDEWALAMQIRLYRQPMEMTESAEALWSLVRSEGARAP
jgi:DNA-binding transcriptional LysR family regulator